MRHDAQAFGLYASIVFGSAIGSETTGHLSLHPPLQREEGTGTLMLPTGRNRFRVWSLVVEDDTMTSPSTWNKSSPPHPRSGGASCCCREVCGG